MAFKDEEMNSINLICQRLALLKPQARRRVLAYVCARSESLPVLAAVGGGIEEEAPSSLFDTPDDVPQMPTLSSARA